MLSRFVSVALTVSAFDLASQVIKTAFGTCLQDFCSASAPVILLALGICINL